MDNPYPMTPKNEFTTPRKRMSYFNSKNSNYYKQGTRYNPSEIHPSSCTTVYDEGDNNIRILSSPTPSQENQNKPSFMLINNLTSTPNNKSNVPSKDRLTKKLSTMSLKENINLNQEDLKKNDEVEFIATTPEDELKRKNSNDDKINGKVTTEFTIKPIQRQNSMVLTREQLKQMSKEKEKEKIPLHKNSEEITESLKKENDGETLDDDLKNIMIQGIDSNKSSDIEIVKINHENTEPAPENSSRKPERKKNKKRRKKKKNVLLSPKEGYSNPLNSSQKSEEIIKNIKVGQALMGPGNQQHPHEMNKEKSENHPDHKKINKSFITATSITESDKQKKKNKVKKKRSKRRETIIPETPSVIRSDLSSPEENKQGASPKEKKVYIWKTNYQNHENVANVDNQNQNPSFIFGDNDEEEEEDDLDISKEIKKSVVTGNKEIIHGNKKQEEEEEEEEEEKESIVVKDHDITINDNDIDIIEVIKNVSNSDTNNTIKFKKTKQQTLFNYTNSRNEMTSSPINR
ncbi:hypothetical protein PIROE2DRAFT_65273 [Piromyces sp. E2]|nr:hypothetical protein PIROE2DRAFT_65273 [Piromyces sp. E2]|eukprot:OUM56964.1 hypothetical protein PIROE2DRAFT_65273 [Piromyces sp. E2]